MTDNLPLDLIQGLILFMGTNAFEISKFRRVYSETHNKCCTMNQSEFVRYLSGSWFSDPQVVAKWRAFVLPEPPKEEPKDIKVDQEEGPLVPYKHRSLDKDQQCFVDGFYEFMKVISLVHENSSHFAKETDFFVALNGTLQVYMGLITAINIDIPLLFEIFDALFEREHKDTSCRTLTTYLNTVTADKEGK